MSDKSLVERAEHFARAVHAGQMRKDGRTPFIAHPLAVGAMLQSHGYSDECVAAGLLHDTIEDTVTEAADLDIAVGATVRRLVEEASEPDKSLNWDQRKRHTIAALPGRSIDAKRVIAADKIHNVESIGAELRRDGERIWSRYRAPRDAQAWYYRTIAELLGDLDEPIFAALRLRVSEVFGDSATPRMDTAAEEGPQP